MTMNPQNLQSLKKTTAFKVSVAMLPILTISSLIISPLAQAAQLNPGFENGLANWTPSGDVSLDTGLIGSGPLFGNSQALLTTASLEQDDFPFVAGAFNFSGNSAVSTGSPSDLETALGLSPGDLDISPFLQAFEGSAIVQSFTVEEGETISFSWNFLTNDSNSDFPLTLGSPRDYAFIVLDGTITTLADTNSSFLSSSSTLFNQETGFQTFTSNPLTAGVYTLGIGIVDIQDTASTSALLIDAPQETPVTTSEPSSKLGLLLLITLGVSSLVKRWS
ncbi:hypothetical protein [Cyanothece sp. BG0011]|uniref:hypothetical protein n=2 Tax=Cyanothece sp. BG0011 TaxID=2082950 RepID=UPI001E376473|nr:hypothetical protein [Cyanothece sp. BG0011]